MRINYIAPTLTEYGNINTITGIIGASKNDDFLTINGMTVANGLQHPSNSGPNPGDVHSCDFLAISGGRYSLVSDQADGRCWDVLDDYLDPNSPGLDQDY